MLSKQTPDFLAIKQGIVNLDDVKIFPEMNLGTVFQSRQTVQTNGTISARQIERGARAEIPCRLTC